MLDLVDILKVHYYFICLLINEIECLHKKSYTICCVVTPALIVILWSN